MYLGAEPTNDLLLTAHLIKVFEQIGKRFKYMSKTMRKQHFVIPIRATYISIYFRAGRLLRL